jgi:hypothetical protein
MSNSQLMSQMIINPSVSTSDIQYEVSRASFHDTLGPSTRVSETQPHEVRRHEWSHHQTRPRDTYNPTLIMRIFDQRR